MILSADYHTHTIYSHGKGDILDNAISAKNNGLIELGITDHGFSHPAFGLSKRKIPLMLEKIKTAKLQTNVNVLMGIESNIIGLDGIVDLKSEMYDNFDIFIAGIHKFVMYRPFTIPVFLGNYIRSTLKIKPSESLIKNNTKLYINSIKKNPIDIISHLNYCCFSDSLEVAKCASDYGTFIELNSKKTHLSDQEIQDIVDKTDAKFVIDSDAHTPDRVGEISLVKDLLHRVNIPNNRIANIDGKIPDFRFKRFKSEAGR